MPYYKGPRTKRPAQRWLEKVCPIIPSGHIVYIMYGTDRTVYYVGRTSNGSVRLAEHSREPLKRKLVTHVQIISLKSFDEMMATERDTIIRLNPLWNSGLQ